MRDLLVICPTTVKRAKPFRLMLTSYFQTVSPRVSTDLCVVCDDAGVPYPSWVPDARIIKRVSKHQATTAKVNEAVFALPPYRAYTILTDDRQYQTYAWNYTLFHCAARPGISFPNDSRRRDFPEIALVTGDIVHRLGWLMLPVVRHAYADHAWEDLGQALGFLQWCKCVQVLHDHKDDEVSDRVRAWGAYDGEAYSRWRHGPGFASAVSALRQLSSRSGVPGPAGAGRAGKHTPGSG